MIMIDLMDPGGRRTTDVTYAASYILRKLVFQEGLRQLA